MNNFVVSRACDFSDDGFSDRTVIVCDQVFNLIFSVYDFFHVVFIDLSPSQCEKEYHIGCLRVHKEIFLQVGE